MSQTSPLLWKLTLVQKFWENLSAQSTARFRREGEVNFDNSVQWRIINGHTVLWEDSVVVVRSFRTCTQAYTWRYMKVPLVVSIEHLVSNQENTTSIFTFVYVSCTTGKLSCMYLVTDYGRLMAKFLILCIQNSYPNPKYRKVANVNARY